MFSKTAYQTTRKGRNHWRGNQGGDCRLWPRFPQPELIAGQGLSKAEGIIEPEYCGKKKMESLGAGSATGNHAWGSLSAEYFRGDTVAGMDAARPPVTPPSDKAGDGDILNRQVK